MPHWVEFIFLQWLPWLLRMDRPGRPLSAKSIMLRLFIPSEISRLIFEKNIKNFPWQILWQLEHGNNKHYSIFNIQSSNFNNQIIVFSCRQRLWQLDKGDKPNNSGLVTPGEFETPRKDIFKRRVLVSSHSFLRGDRCNIPENPYWF